MPSGRELLWMMNQKIIRNDFDVSIGNYKAVENVRLRGDDLKGYMIDCRAALLTYGSNPPPTQILFKRFEREIWKSAQLSKRLELFALQCSQHRKDPTYKEYVQLVEIHLEDKEKRIIKKAYEQESRERFEG